MKNANESRLVGYIWQCGDPECACSQAVIEMERDGRTERVWEGSFFPDPSSYDWQDMRNELTEAAERHALERDSLDSDWWEREL